MDKLLKITFEHENKIMTLEGEDCEKWEIFMEAAARHLQNHCLTVGEEPYDTSFNWQTWEKKDDN